MSKAIGICKRHGPMKVYSNPPRFKSYDAKGNAIYEAYQFFRCNKCLTEKRNNAKFKYNFQRV